MSKQQVQEQRTTTTTAKITCNTEQKKKHVISRNIKKWTDATAVCPERIKLRPYPQRGREEGHQGAEVIKYLVMFSAEAALHAAASYLYLLAVSRELRRKRHLQKGK